MASKEDKENTVPNSRVRDLPPLSVGGARKLEFEGDFLSLLEDAERRDTERLEQLSSARLQLHEKERKEVGPHQRPSSIPLVVLPSNLMVLPTPGQKSVRGTSRFTPRPSPGPGTPKAPLRSKSPHVPSRLSQVAAIGFSGFGAAMQ